ncbi:spore germination protein [Aneurinibacillus sp. Ricciae_BoGa-3]|uniref:spore germination protein n=1 Tax=Aneurinibacillus sp. Ricciae_BoGa-3 TaxID=3022697 RepID=UPI00233F9DF9|nr:spore germination protein [Aneurinibacillus sp. Ricciae_BoGa-3]WCK54547.1 spore germination protein [Aneurinibacillus sp. Ricciae_BoGa-3]
MGLIKTIKKILNRTPPHSKNKSSDQKNPLKNRIQENFLMVKETLGNSSDLVSREIRIGKTKKMKAGILYIDGLTDANAVNNFIMETLMINMGEIEVGEAFFSHPNQLQLLKDAVLTVGEIQEVRDFETLYTSMLSGDTAILLDGYSQGFTISLKGGKDRGVAEPTTQTVIRGPRDGFTENIRTNTALIRRKINNPNLWLETKKIGTQTKTNVSIMYIKGIVNDKIVEEVHRRLDRIEIDGILESGYIEELIQDETFSPFPTIFNTERPDVIAAGLLEGRVAILADGTPFVLLVPTLFVSFFQTAEDYYQRGDIATLIRMIRFLSLFIALLAPSLYIAITTFHQEMIPTTLLVSLAAQREGVPFPAFIEAIIMEVTFEILREAGIRMPKAVGQSVSIVGALVIGTAAVEAGIISAAMVIVVSITAISNFVFPAFNMAISIRILRFGMMFLAASFGFYGITLGLIAMVLHLCSLRSFGVPYMSPFAPFNMTDQKDAIFRVPWWGMFSRPRLISQKNIRREQNPPTAKPEPDQRYNQE